MNKSFSVLNYLLQSKNAIKFSHCIKNIYSVIFLESPLKKKDLVVNNLYVLTYYVYCRFDNCQ